MGNRRGTCSILVGKCEGNKLLGRYRLVWEDNIRMDLQEITSTLWIGLM